MSETLRRTPLFETHVRTGARMVPFAGWEMPVQYSGVMAEVKAVREAVGLFDVSHMGRAQVTGTGATEFLQHLTVNDISKLTDGQGHYSLLCYDDGGVVDDIIVYRVEQERYTIIFNAGNRDKDLAWMREHLTGFDAQLTDQSDATALIAVQGPKALELLGATAAGLVRFGIQDAEFAGIPVTACRTGYTGEDGAELICAAESAIALWDALVAAGAVPAGLGARDALRLEAALPLYGHEMDETVNPYEARLGWVVKLDKGSDFVGKAALQAVKAAGPSRKCVGITLEGKAIPREGYPVCLPGGDPIGHITSGTFSPTVARGIAMARVASAVAKTGTTLEVEIRGARHAATVVALPFYKNV